MPSGSYKRGGHPRPLKPGKKQKARKAFQATLRARALNGIGHNADGNQQNSVGATASSTMGRDLYYGWKLHKAKR